MNLEQLTNISIDTDKTKDIANLCNELLSQNKTVEQAEVALKNAKAEQLRLSEEVIPAVMSEVSVEECMRAPHHAGALTLSLGSAFMLFHQASHCWAADSRVGASASGSKSVLRPVRS